MMYDEHISDVEEDTDKVVEYDIWKMELEPDKDKLKKQKLSVNDAKCGSVDCLMNVVSNFAVYLCFACNIYLCGDCFRVHDSNHEFVTVESEVSEKQRMGEVILERMRTEKIADRDFYKENASVYGRIYMKHELDKKDCWITGLCSLQNKRLVGLDTFNNSMKIFSTVSSKMLRYIRFGSSPRDATEIKVNLKFPESDTSSSSRSYLSGASRDEPHKQCLLAVTFPWMKQIWFIDVNKSPAVKTKTIQIETGCRAIEFHDNKIFILAREEIEYEPRDSVLILAADGSHIQVIKNKPNRFIQYIPDLAIYQQTIYLTDWDHHKVLCINKEDGKTLSHITIPGSRPRGVCLDSSNNVYMCGWRHNKVYKLSPDLQNFEPLNLDTDFTREPYRMCYAHGKLFIGLDWNSPFRNFVTVVQVT